MRSRKMGEKEEEENFQDESWVTCLKKNNSKLEQENEKILIGRGSPKAKKIRNQA